MRRVKKKKGGGELQFSSFMKSDGAPGAHSHLLRWTGSFVVNKSIVWIQRADTFAMLRSSLGKRFPVFTMTKRCIAMVLLLLVACLRRTDASEITRSLRERIRKQQQALESGDDDESSKDAVASKAKKVVPSDGIEYWKYPIEQNYDRMTV